MKYLIRSDSENGYWHDIKGWVQDPENADLFDGNAPLPVACGGDARHLLVKEATLFGSLLIRGLIVGHYDADLYAYDTRITRRIIELYPQPTNGKPRRFFAFTSMIAGGLQLLDIPYAYEPYWWPADDLIDVGSSQASADRTAQP